MRACNGVPGGNLAVPGHRPLLFLVLGKEVYYGCN